MTKVKNQKHTSVADQLNHNTAFMSRSKKEEERHQAQMSEKLRNDMLRIRHEEIFPDMQYVNGSHVFPGHQLIIRSRLHGVPIDDWFQSSPGELPVLQLSQKSPDESRTFLDTLYTSEHVEKGFIIRGLKLPDHVDISGLVDCSDEVPNIADNQTQNGPEETESADVRSPQTSQTIRSEDEQLASSTLPDAVVEEAEVSLKNGSNETSADDEGSQDAENENGSARELTATKDTKPEDIDSDENTGANSHCQGKQGSAGYSAVSAENNAGDSKILESSTGDSSVTETASLPDSLTSENGAHSNQLNKDEGDDTEVTSNNSSKDSPVKECPATAENTTVGLAEEKCEGDNNKKDISYRPCSNLSSDLLQFYQSGDKTDCCLKVEGQKLMAHRCILAARCEYFSAMFAGSWSETDEIEIELHDVKAQSIKYILLFLYGAMVDVPITDITAVIQASDMYGVQGFKDWLCFQIVRDFCHFFHKPCQDCTRMVPDVLVLATQFNLTDLSERAKRWMATHFRRIWEMQTFGSLPPSLLEECTMAVIDQMSIQNITQIILDAHDLARTLQQNHRSEQVQIAAIQITDKALAFCAQNFPQLVKSPNFFSWSKSGAWCLDLLAESYTMAVSLLQPDAACEVYTSLRNQLAHCEKTTADGGGGIASREVQQLLKKLVKRCEWYFHRYIHGVMQCPQWEHLPKELQQELLQKSSFVPVHAASAVGAQSRVAQKSAKTLQDNIEHTVNMLCETDPTLFPSLSQTRKILPNNTKHLPKRSEAKKDADTKTDTKSASQKKGIGKTAAAPTKAQKGTSASAAKSAASGTSAQTRAEVLQGKQGKSGSASSPRPSSAQTSRDQGKGSAATSSYGAARPDSARNSSFRGTGASASSAAARPSSLKGNPTGATVGVKATTRKTNPSQGKGASASDKAAEASSVNSSQEQATGGSASATTSQPNSAKSKTTSGPTSSQSHDKTNAAPTRTSAARSRQGQAKSTAESATAPRPSSSQSSQRQSKTDSAPTRPSSTKSYQAQTKSSAASAAPPKPSSSKGMKPSLSTRPSSAKANWGTSTSASTKGSTTSTDGASTQLATEPTASKSGASNGGGASGRPSSTPRPSSASRPPSASASTEGPRPGPSRTSKHQDKRLSMSTIQPIASKTKFQATSRAPATKALSLSFAGPSSGTAGVSARERAALYARGIAGRSSALNGSKAGPSGKNTLKTAQKEAQASKPAQTVGPTKTTERADRAAARQPPATKSSSAVADGKTSNGASSKGAALSKGGGSSQVHNGTADQGRRGNQATQTSISYAESDRVKSCDENTEASQQENPQVETHSTISSAASVAEAGDPGLHENTEASQQENPQVETCSTISSAASVAEAGDPGLHENTEASKQENPQVETYSTISSAASVAEAGDPGLHENTEASKQENPQVETCSTISSAASVAEAGDPGLHENTEASKQENPQVETHSTISSAASVAEAGDPGLHENTEASKQENPQVETHSTISSAASVAEAGDPGLHENTEASKQENPQVETRSMISSAASVAEAGYPGLLQEEGNNDDQKTADTDDKTASGKEREVQQPLPVQTNTAEDAQEQVAVIVQDQGMALSCKEDIVTESRETVAGLTQVSKDVEESVLLDDAAVGVETDKVSAEYRNQERDSSSADTEQPSVVCQTIEPETVEPGTIEPGSTEPKTVIPDTIEPVAMEPETTEPKTVMPDTIGPVAMEPETVKAETVEPGTIEPETTEPKTVIPDTIEPVAMEPETVKAETVEPGTIEPETTEPKTVVSDTTEPAVMEPKTVDPQTVEPETTEYDDDMEGSATPKRAEIPPEKTENASSPAVMSKTEEDEGMSVTPGENKASPSKGGESPIPTIVINTGDDSTEETTEETPETVTKETGDTSDTTMVNKAETAIPTIIYTTEDDSADPDEETPIIVTTDARDTSDPNNAEGQSRVESRIDEETSVPSITITTDDEDNASVELEPSEKTDETEEVVSASATDAASDLIKDKSLPSITITTDDEDDAPETPEQPEKMENSEEPESVSTIGAESDMNSSGSQEKTAVTEDDVSAENGGKSNDALHKESANNQKENASVNVQDTNEKIEGEENSHITEEQNSNKGRDETEFRADTSSAQSHEKQENLAENTLQDVNGNCQE